MRLRGRKAHVLTGHADRRNSTILNPRSYVTADLWKQAPILTGTTKFEPLPDAHNILVTGGAGFMYVVEDWRHMQRREWH